MICYECIYWTNILLVHTRLVTSLATAKSKCQYKSTILKSKSTLSGQVEVRVQKAKSTSKSSMENVPASIFIVFQYPIPELILKYSWQVLI